MQARPNKCSATAMRQSNSVGSAGITGYDRFDPHLSIAGASIRYLDDGDFRYLGRLLNTAASEITSRCQLQEKLDALLSLLDKTLLPATSRLWLYHHFVVPKLSWAFLTLDLTLTFVKSSRPNHSFSWRNGLACPDVQTPPFFLLVTAIAPV